MSGQISTQGSAPGGLSERILQAMAGFWFVVAVTGLWIFVYYLAVFYGGAALRGQITEWGNVLPDSYVSGDLVGTVAIAVHLLLAVIVIFGGPLQLVPQIRNRFRTFHRWNGRVYMLAACITSLVGLYLVWVRGGTTGDLIQHLGISLDAILIITFAVIALRHAMAREIAIHRRWALRLFMVVNAVWFFRIGLMFWLMVNGGPVGIDMATFTGPFLTFLTFAQTLVPLALLELYLRARNGGSAAAQFAMAGVLGIVTLAMGVGIFAATMGLWLPHV